MSNKRKTHVREVRCDRCGEVVNHSDEWGPFFAKPLPCKCTTTTED